MNDPICSFSALNRDQSIDRLKSETYDLLVIGGGITGAGIALDAVSRGLKTALVEKADFAFGASSRSTKLIHGGLRYLKQFEIALVREVGRERSTLHRNAPHLVPSEKILLPLIKDGTFGKLKTSLGLMAYDALAGVESNDQRKMLSKAEALKKEPLLNETTLEGGGFYAEYRTDDARLTVEVVKTAVQYGAECMNYVSALDFTYKDEKVSGIRAKDQLSGKEFSIRSRYVVSAAGPWVDELRNKNHSLIGKRLHLTKGVHIVVPRTRLPLHQAIYFDVEDGRMIFSIPRGLVTYIGTTDTEYSGNKDHIHATKKDVLYLLEATNQMFPAVDLEIKDVISSWAGIRPLIHETGKSASEISRKDEIFESDTGLISIAGGKLTGFRKMAERVVDLISKKYGKEYPGQMLGDCKTKNIPLTGGVFTSSEEVKVYKASLFSRLKAYGFDEYMAFYLVSNYGKQSDTILAFFDEFKDKDIYRGMIKAECRFCIEYESIYNMRDFFVRRTGRLYFDIDSVKVQMEMIADYMAEYLGWSKKNVKAELSQMQLEIANASTFT